MVLIGSIRRALKRAFNFEVQQTLSGDSSYLLSELLYRNAVPSHSPGLPLRLPWVTEVERRFNRNAVALAGATRSGLRTVGACSPGLKQPWALRRNRFAVPVPQSSNVLHFRVESTKHNLRVVVHGIIAIGDYVWAHVNFINLFNDDAQDRGIAGVDIYKMNADGKALEHWDVLQEVGDPKNAAHANGMF